MSLIRLKKITEFRSLFKKEPILFHHLSTCFLSGDPFLTGNPNPDGRKVSCPM
jgi:hypothetical protein